MMKCSSLIIQKEFYFRHVFSIHRPKIEPKCSKSRPKDSGLLMFLQNRSWCTESEEFCSCCVEQIPDRKEREGGVYFEEN